MINPPVKDSTPSNTHHAPSPLQPPGQIKDIIIIILTTCTQGLQAQRRDQKSLSFLAKKSVASAFAAASAPLS